MHFEITFFLLFYYVLNVLSDKCRTPNDEEAECISIRSCPILLDAAISLQPAAIEFAKKSQCGSNGTDPLVCCGTSASYGSSTTAPTSAKDKTDLLPSRRYCGYQRFDDYFHTGQSAAVPSIDEFPWLAALVFKADDGGLEILCTGSLISNRYVLTAAHCARPLHSHTLVGVKLGEYNVVQDEDCIRNGRFDDECTDPIGHFGIEEQITHQGFSYKSKQNDIALIRLNRTVTYSDFVRPICLPFPGTKLAKTGEFLYESGWGRTAFNGMSSDIKKKTMLKLLPIEQCIEGYENSKWNITDYQTCTVESNLSLSCQGDSGGPIMFPHRNQWHQEGIVSFGKACGFGFPGVNTKVVRYLDWILESIRP